MIKRKSNEQPLKEVIEEYLKVFKLDKKLAETRLISSWEPVVGKTIARYTRNLFIANKTLFISLDSAVIRQELSFKKERLITLLNEQAGDRVIEDIVFK